MGVLGRAGTLRQMSRPSDPRLRLLVALRVKGVAGADALATATELAPDEVDALLGELAADGLAREHAGALAGWGLTPAGRAEHARLVAAEVDDAGARGAVRGAYDGFRALNAAVLDACSRWQVRERRGQLVVNDHRDRTYDAAVVADLAQLERRARPVLSTLAGSLDRYGGYGPQLRQAVERVEAGDGDWFTRPAMPSFHTVWFELHEDLLSTLGLDRESEATSAEAC
jgi:hypothetical protein